MEYVQLKEPSRVRVKHWSIKPKIDQPKAKTQTDRELRWELQSKVADTTMRSRSRDNDPDKTEHYEDISD